MRFQLQSNQKTHVSLCGSHLLQPGCTGLHIFPLTVALPFATHHFPYHLPPSLIQAHSCTPTNTFGRTCVLTHSHACLNFTPPPHPPSTHPPTHPPQLHFHCTLHRPMALLAGGCLIFTAAAGWAHKRRSERNQTDDQWPIPLCKRDCG